jgi:hypothetical protein
LLRANNFSPILEQCRRDERDLIIAQPPANPATIREKRTASASFPNTVRSHLISDAFSETGNGNRVTVRRDTPFFAGSRCFWHGTCGFAVKMTRRKQATDAMGLVAQLAGLVVLISLFFPAVRRALGELGFIAVCISILVVAGLVGFGIYRLATRVGRMKSMTDNPFAPPTAAADRTWNDGESETIPDLLYPGRRRRYPWRH